MKQRIREQMQAMNDNNNKLKRHLQEAKDYFNKEVDSQKNNQMENLEIKKNHKRNKKLNGKHHQKTKPLGRQNLRQ